MRVSTKGRYGLRIMVELALRHGSGPVLVTTIAQNQDLPGKYIHVLVGGLKAAGLITAVRGPNGGLELARIPPASPPWTWWKRWKAGSPPWTAPWIRTSAAAPRIA